jgi:Tc toxin complex TcA C-terminal TcB-binding domain/ABC toxin N-terminal region/Neuraminidase-like domain/Salmonella virulence plasmid 28.1kDa A protein
MDPHAALAPDPAPTTWGALHAAVETEAGGTPTAELSPEQVVHLAAAAGIEPRTAANFVDAHAVAGTLEVDVDVGVLFALVSGGVAPDAGSLSAVGEDVQRAAVDRAVAAGTIPDGVAAGAEKTAKALGRVALDRQPIFLAQPAALYATSADAAEATGETATLVADRLDSALQARVATTIGKVSPELSKALHPLLARLDWRQLADRDVTDIAREILTTAGRSEALAQQTAAVVQRIAAAPGLTVRDALHLDAPVAENPLLAADVARGKAVEYARLAGLSDAATRKTLAVAPALADGATPQLDLKKADASALRRVVDLAQLTGDNLPLMRTLDERGTTDPAVLARLSRADWEGLVAAHDIPLPPGATKSSYADALAHNLETAFPTQALAARITDPLVQRFYAQNPELDLRSADLVLGGGTKLDWTGITKTQRPALETQLKAHQRVIALAPTSDLQATLLEHGFDSAFSIARQTQADFVERTGISAVDAQDVYQRALNAASQAAHSYSAIRDVVRGSFAGLAIGNVAPELVNDLRRIDGFSDLFGPQDFCNCDDCHSVLSPAAYFCDLMHFVEVQVSRPVFVNAGQANHPLHLKTRRPDLWTLPLTCDNTKTLVPYLTIVDEVLEAFLGTIVGGDIYATLADPNDKVSFHSPFVLPFAELTLYLSHFGLAPADIYHALQLADGKVWRARLGLAPVEAQVATTPDSANVAQRLGSPTTLSNFDVQEFLRLTGLSRTDLDAVLALRSFTDLAQIDVAKQKTPDELQNFPEILQQLTATRLDLIHRFLRIQRATPWAIGDLDLVILAAREAGLAGADVDETLVETLGQLVELQTKLKVSVEEICALADGLPVSAAFPLQPAHTSDLKLYERLFDLPKLFGLANPATGELNQTVTFHHYSLDTANPADTTIDPKTPLLLAGLGISETELLLLFDLLKDELPFDANGDCTLDRAKLSLLYRHVRVGRALHFAVDDLIRALQLIFAPGSEPLKTLAQLRALIDFQTWLHGSPFSTAELRFVLAGVESPTAKFANTPDTVAQLVQQVQALGTTGRVELLKGQLAPLFNITGARLDDQLKWVAADITAAPIQTALDTTFTNGAPDTPSDLDPLVALVQQLERVALLFSNLKLEDDSIHWLTRNASSSLGIASLAQLTLHDVQSLTFYRTLATLRDTVEPEVQAALAAYVAAGTVSPGADRQRLSDLWQVDTSLVDSLVDVLPLPAAAIDAFARLSDGLQLCGTLGVNGYSLQKLGDDADYAALQTAGDVALGAFAAKYDDETVRETTLEPYQDRINVAKRDALCDYVIARQPDLKFRDHSEIYDYFLLDVDMSGCFRTSRVVCAISSVQLYAQRCTLDLEQSDPTLNPSIPDIHVDPSRIPADEWEWRKNYRVWEANREVYLYPEAYLDETLRDDVTPICQDLEDNLLQQKVTKGTAADAYARYMAAFAELAHLRICGSLFHQGTYYFFGATQQDPPVFYYRTWDERTWSPWQKIDLAIEAPYVAATVHLGRLYIFWANGKSKDHTSISNGNSQLDYYEVHVDLAYSYLNPEGKWISPQKLPWLYPSENETVSATNEVFSDDALTEMELSKSYLKMYPSVVGDTIVLRYYNPGLNPNCYFDRALDLFHNRLHAGNGAPNLPAASAVILFEDGTNAQLGVETQDFTTDQFFDEDLEQPAAVVTAHTLITQPFPQPTYPTTDPRRTDVMHSVIDSYPESTFLHGDQQYLIHEKRSRLSQRIVDTPARAAIAGAAGGAQLAMTTRAYTLTSPYISDNSAIGLIGRAPNSVRELVRLSTSRADDLGEILVSDGLDAFFALSTQTLTEKPIGITITDLSQLAPPNDDPNHLSFNGAFGTYYRELFLHIPWLIASHLKANQQFEDAMGWYARIFDPTATESPQDVLPTDRNWRYVEFRNLAMPTLEQILTDQAAIDAYKTDPFNPFAIARLRPSAFQKAIVMQYVSNLLDWGDSLFAQDTMESINEATMLYVLAAEILGKRPASLGDCETAPDEDLTYEKIGPAIDAGSEFLVQLENWTYVVDWQTQLQRVNEAVFANTASEALTSAALARAPAATALNEAIDRPLVSVREKADVRSTVLQDAPSLRPYQLVAQQRAADTGTQDGVAVVGGVSGGFDWHTPILRAPNIHLVEQSTLVFCVPPDKELLKYWDRVEDRLFKIRNCMNISGVLRSLSLFAPEINPMALVRAKAAGLSLEEALGLMAAPVPPYRFTYLVERARQAAAQVSSFGASLLSALEKKDVEELTLLKSVHEQTIERMTKDVKTRAVEEAQFSLQAVIENETNVQNKIAYYQGLIDAGLSGWELTQQITRHLGTKGRLDESMIQLNAAIMYLIPQVGSPFSMKYGGKEMGDSMSSWAAWAASMAGIFEAVSASAGLEATFQRRSQEWRQALSQAQQELKQLAQTHQAAQKRADMAQKDLDIHQTTMDHTTEVYAFYKDKFTSLGLYNYLASTLTRLHREAYNAAHDLAALAERAYGYETDDDTVFVAPDNYQFDKAGLLAGERLQLQLQQLETSYVKTNTRRFEVTQSFSLALSQPAALVDLRAKGNCEFALPEVLFDLAYPGQYKRLIKAVRLTIPCVAGPYTNVSAKLTLTQSQVRTQTTTDPNDLLNVPLQTTQSISTSTAQNDGGMFELNFRDERYLPFEGAGAVSAWRLELPTQLRTFDYDTIGDVIVHVSYTALDDDLFRGTVESQIVDELTTYASANGMQRLFSLRHDFPNAFQQLMYPPGASQATQLEVGTQHFPYFLSAQKLSVTGVSVFLESQDANPVNTTGLKVAVNGTNSGTWSVPAETALKKADVSVSGSPLKTWDVGVSKGTLDPTLISDVFILVSYDIV